MGVRVRFSEPQKKARGPLGILQSGYAVRSLVQDVVAVSPQVGTDGIAYPESLRNQVAAKTAKKLTAGTPGAQSRQDSRLHQGPINFNVSVFMNEPDDVCSILCGESFLFVGVSSGCRISRRISLVLTLSQANVGDDLRSDTCRR